jgi:hypothetical protein
LVVADSDDECATDGVGAGRVTAISDGGGGGGLNDALDAPLFSDDPPRCPLATAVANTIDTETPKARHRIAFSVEGGVRNIQD